MYTLSMVIDETAGVPTSIKAKEVEWNAVTEKWDQVVAGTSYIADKSTSGAISGNLHWYHINIALTKHYSVILDDAATAIEGYEGKFIDVGDTKIAVAANTVHSALAAGNPHEVTTTELLLQNVQNLTAVAQVNAGLTTAAQIVATGVDVADLPDTAEGKFVTVANILAGMVDGSANANTLLDFIGTRLGANALFAKMSSEVLFVSSGTAAANTITPKKIGAIYVKTDDSYDYVSKGLTTSDWIDIT